jgi:hypothetical protein
VTSAPAGAARPAVWFPDTSALVSLAVDLPLQQAVQATLSPHRRVLVAAVVAELHELAKTVDRAASWAGTAMGQLHWLGEPVRVDEPAGVELAAEIQEQIAAGRPLKHPLEHFGEAAIISLACRAKTLRPLLLSDDYDARIAAKNRGVEPLSVHKLIHLMIKQNKITASEAFGFADALNKAGRAQDYTQAELTSGRLGRVGQP